MQVSPLYITHTAGNFHLAAQAEGEVHLAGWVILHESSPGKLRPVRKFTEAKEVVLAWNDVKAGVDANIVKERNYA